MDRTAITTNPLSYSKACDTFRPRIGQTAATRTGLGGKRFVHFFNGCAVRNRFIAEHVSEGRPSRVIDALCQLGFGKTFGVHVANGDVIKLVNQSVRQLVQKIATTVFYFGGNVCDLSFVSRSLRNAQFGFERSVVARIVDFLARGQRGKFFQAEVNADAIQNGAGFPIGHFDHDIQKPVAAPVLSKTGAVLDLSFRQGPGIEYAKCVTSESERIAVAFQVPTFEWHPAQRPLAAIAKERALELLARLGVLLAHGIDRAGVNSKFFAAACGQDIQIKAGRPALAPFERMFLRVVAEVPHIGHRPRLLVQQAVQRLHAVAVNLRAHWRFRYSSMARRMCSAIEIPVFSDRALSAAITGSGRNMCVRFMHILYLCFHTAVQPVGCAPFLPGLNAGASRSIR
jgi:hypothetical protein